MSASHMLAFGAITFALFACESGPPEACNHEGCGSYHDEQSRSEGLTAVIGSIAITAPARRIDSPATQLQIDVADDGTLDITGPVPEDATPCESDAGGDCPQHPSRTRAHVPVTLPGEPGVEDLAGTELWICASPSAALAPMAAPDGNVAPGCLDHERDVVPAIRARLEGTIELLPPPIDLIVTRAEDSAFGLHYRIDTTATSEAEVHLDVVTWRKRTLVSCGGVY